MTAIAWREACVRGLVRWIWCVGSGAWRTPKITPKLDRRSIPPPCLRASQLATIDMHYRVQRTIMPLSICRHRRIVASYCICPWIGACEFSYQTRSPGPISTMCALGIGWQSILVPDQLSGNCPPSSVIVRFPLFLFFHFHFYFHCLISLIVTSSSLCH